MARSHLTSQSPRLSLGASSPVSRSGYADVFVSITEPLCRRSGDGNGGGLENVRPGACRFDSEEPRDGTGHGPDRTLHQSSSAAATLKLNIIPLSWCSAMWQCAIHRPALVTSRRMSTVWPVGTRTVSFQTRLGSITPSRDRMRNRPAPWTWKGWCIG